MEKKFKVIIILQVLVILALGGYLVYDKCIAKENTSTTVEKTETKEATEKTTDTTADEETVKEIFINEFLLKPDFEKPLDYKIDKITILTGKEKQEIVDMGYKTTDILATVVYSVKVEDTSTSKWNAGNGEAKDSQWFVNKSAVMAVRDGKLETIGTGW